MTRCYLIIFFSEVLGAELHPPIIVFSMCFKTNIITRWVDKGKLPKAPHNFSIFVFEPKADFGRMRERLLLSIWHKFMKVENPRKWFSSDLMPFVTLKFSSHSHQKHASRRMILTSRCRDDVPTLNPDLIQKWRNFAIKLVVKWAFDLLTFEVKSRIDTPPVLLLNCVRCAKLNQRRCAPPFLDLRKKQIVEWIEFTPSSATTDVCDCF